MPRYGDAATLAAVLAPIQRHTDGAAGVNPSAGR